MSVKIKLKHSSVANKAPLPTDLEAGELALNTNTASPAAYIKDSAGNIVKLAGAGAIGGTAATETAAGIVELATAAETEAGTDNTRAVHPAGLKATLDAHLTPGTSTPPAAPTVGATYINTAVTPAVLNVWSGTAWVPQVGTATASGTAPAAPAAGQVWVDTSGATSVTKVWDGTSWVVMKVDTGTQAKLDAQVASIWNRTGTTLSPATTGDLVTPAVLPAATTSVQGAVQLADAGAVTAGTAGRVVDAAQLKAAVAAENIWDRSSVTGVGGLTVTTGSSAITAIGAALQNVAVTSSSGGGTGLSVNLTVTGGVVTAASVAAAGSGYAVNDTVTIAKAGVAGAAADIVLTVGALATAVVSPANAGDVVNISAGTAALPGLTPVGDPDTGIYSPGADQVAISTNGTQRVTVSSSGDVYFSGSSADPFARSDARQFAVNGVSASDSAAINVNAGSSSGRGGQLNLGQGGTRHLGLIGNTNESTIGTLSNTPLRFETNSTERARIDSSGRLLVGTSSARSVGGSDAAALQLTGTGGNSFFNISRYTNNNGGASLQFGKSRGSSDGSYSIVSANDQLGAINFCGADGIDLDTIAATIQAQVDGTPGANVMPGRLVFSTTADGASSPTERMRISKDSTIGFGNTVAAPANPVFKMTLKASGVLNLATTTVYADNAAALAGGLVTGDIYRKADGTLMITF